MSLTAAGPGTGKSLLWLTYSLLCGVPTIYFSADSDKYDQIVRALAILNRWTVTTAREVVDNREYDRMGALKNLPVRFEFDASPTLETMANRVEAFWHLYGEYPSLIVGDNLTNIRTEISEMEGNPFAGLEGLSDYVHTMARETGAHVAVLHHVKGEYVNGEKPIPLDGIKDQVTRVPETVLTLHRPYEGALGVSYPKLRGGQPDPTGHSFVELAFDGSRVRIWER